jgi:hypothetical protein
MQTVSRRVILLVLSVGVLLSVGAQAQFASSNESGAVFVMNNSASRTRSFPSLELRMDRSRKLERLRPAVEGPEASPILWSLRAHLH